MLLRRSKSSDLKKQQAAREAERQRDAVSKAPPRLPVLYNGAPAPQLGLGGDRPDSLAIVSGRIDTMTTGHAPAPAPAPAPRPSIEPSRSVVSIPAPPVPIPNGGFDPYAGATSMAHRGRYSYASSAVSTINSPRRLLTICPSILIVGTTNSGKTSFLEFLKTALALPAKRRAKSSSDNSDDYVPKAPVGNFIPHYLETEIDGERIGMTLWDSEGLEKNVVDLQLREMSSFIESKFEETFNEEMKVVRSPGFQDTHIHAVFLVLDPARLDRNIAAAKATSGQSNGASHYPHARVLGALDEDLDLQVLRTLQGKTAVIPVVSKADTVTTKHMNILKKTVAESLKKANLDPLESLGLDEDEDDSNPDSDKIVEEPEEDEAQPGEEVVHAVAEPGEEGAELPPESQRSTPQSKRNSSGSIRRHMVAAEESAKEDEIPFLPMSILSPDIYEPEIVGRQFPWGFADPYNEEHCDFVRLKETVFSEWRAELRELSREQWYEGWRTSRLKQQGGGGTDQ
ncbi:hypothetical protein VTJ49DRAFT_6836 [Mycothermus thermophilus]|uniref:Septin-type G domain-containing protein n=1 Tax=Humicola insolens TaxID=85995 RepID=A0ABR3VPQ2_HUMIN